MEEHALKGLSLANALLLLAGPFVNMVLDLLDRDSLFFLALTLWVFRLQLWARIFT